MYSNQFSLFGQHSVCQDVTKIAGVHFFAKIDFCLLKLIVKWLNYWNIMGFNFLALDLILRACEEDHALFSSHEPKAHKVS